MVRDARGVEATKGQLKKAENMDSAWFANDNVFLSADHVPYLRRICPSHTVQERLAKVPYVGLVMPQVPYYIYVGARAA